MDAALYSVKEAGAADAAARFSGMAFEKLKNGAAALFRNHPLPTYQARVQTSPGRVTDFFNRAAGGPRYQGPRTFSQETRSGYGTGLLNRLKTTGHAVGDFARESFFGSPLSVAKEIRDGGLKNYYKNFFSPDGSRALTALQGAMTGKSVYDAATSDPEHRGETTGRAVADAALLPLTARLGLPGQMLLRGPALNLAGRAGKLFDRSPPSAPPPVPE